MGRGEFGEAEYLAYDLDVTRLHWMAQRRAADRLGVDVDDLRGLPIKAGADIEIENEGETAVSPDWVKRPFVFARQQESAYAAST